MIDRKVKICPRKYVGILPTRAVIIITVLLKIQFSDFCIRQVLIFIQNHLYKMIFNINKC